MCVCVSSEFQKEQGFRDIYFWHLLSTTAPTTARSASARLRITRMIEYDQPCLNIGSGESKCICMSPVVRRAGKSMIVAPSGNWMSNKANVKAVKPPIPVRKKKSTQAQSERKCATHRQCWHARLPSCAATNVMWSRLQSG